MATVGLGSADLSPICEKTIPNSLGGTTDLFRGQLYLRGPRRMAISGRNGDPEDMSPICEETVSVIPGYGADLLTSQLFLRAPRKMVVCSLSFGGFESVLRGSDIHHTLLGDRFL